MHLGHQTDGKLKANRYIVICSKYKMHYNKNMYFCFPQISKSSLFMFYAFQTPISQNSWVYEKKDHSSFLQAKHFYKFFKPPYIVGNIYLQYQCGFSNSPGKIKTSPSYCKIRNTSAEHSPGLLPLQKI